MQTDQECGEKGSQKADLRQIFLSSDVLELRCANLAGLEFVLILLPLVPKCQDYRRATVPSNIDLVGIETRNCKKQNKKLPSAVACEITVDLFQGLSPVS